jgi:PEP-CTERM motif
MIFDLWPKKGTVMDAIKAAIGSLLLAACLPSTALAVPITGSFAGIANGWRTIGYGEQWSYDNEPVTGTFAFETSFDEGTVYENPDSVMYFDWPVSVSFDLFGYTASFSPESDGYSVALILGESQQRQTAELWFFAAYSNASLTFVAPNGGLFDSFDPETFNPAAVDIAASYATFSSHTRSDSASVRFDRITFDGFEPTPVPEPLTLSLFAAGLLGMWSMRRRPARLPAM